MSAPREIEVKLELDAADAAAMRTRGLARFGAGHRVSERLVSVYFDTAKLALRRKGLTLRVRTTVGRHIQTVKRVGAAGAGLFEREEWEVEVAGGEPDVDALAHTPAARVLKKHGRPAPVFTTDLERITWLVEAGGSRIEVALDEGEVRAGHEARHFVELELELKAGPASGLFDLLGAVIDGRVPRIGVETKSERGYRLARHGDQEALTAADLRVTADMTAGEAFRAIALACLRDFRLQETRLSATRHVEALHEARVAMRRLRSSLSLFRAVVTDATLDRLRDGLRTVSRQLGDARNIDVYLAGTARPEAERADAEPGAAAYLAEVEARRERAYDAVIATLDSDEVRRLLLDLLIWVETGPWRTNPDRASVRDQPVAGFSADLLARRSHKLGKRSRHLDRLPPPERHRVRIEAKKLRYAAEFFARLEEGRKARRRQERFVEALKAFQDCLGELNDIETGHELANDLVRAASGSGTDPAPGSDPHALLFAAGRATGLSDMRVAALLHRARRTFRRVSEAKPFWVA